MSFNLYASDLVNNATEKELLHKGVIVSTLPAGVYTYVEVKGENETLWAATNSKKIQKGARVEFIKSLPMQNFKSKILKKTFKTVYFINGLYKEGQWKNSKFQSKVKTAGKVVTSRGRSKETFRQKIKVGSIKKADYTILNLWDKKKVLSGKDVLLRAKVVKVTKQIMKKNWIHLQDGTGTDKFFDIVVTSDEIPTLGEIVLIKGKVSVNKDFGYGYFYKLLIENATLVNI